ncbi:DUF2264 domain-containing protein [Paenibacillus sedimenti]|uniref:DUF2264 domain-containing protein n=1 Tax=Paenibacillus sedimenti TaxID=2770274 RepID=A0A926KUE6_9BACL|nr:DUF2264 domain-containing protein [Paenibacillus sedimenti]MBD0382175.1 DUF2264 domain-containing protein [Paenibacillus sedimenti]
MTKGWELPITRNPLRDKEDLARAFAELTDPLKPHYSKGSARLYIGNTGTSYTDEVAGFEGFSRILWGLAPLLAGGGDSDLWDVYIEGIKNGTNPSHEEYWGDVNHYDQRLVEMAAFGLTMALVPGQLRERLSDQELGRLVDWLSQINDHHLYDCNWLFFRVMVQLGFKKAGLAYSRELIEEILVQIERFYLEDGWYADGVGGHSDYYVPFAIHYYALIYAVFMEEEDPERTMIYRERAALFAQQFIHWFAEDGSSLPYGRSLAYRFSQSAFWSALVFAGVEPFPLGVMKGLVLRNLRWWFAQPIFQADGVLTIGYAYPNLVMAENYNSPGSPYWAMKTFLLLALPDEHPFWAAEELPLLQLDEVAVQKAPHLVMCRQPLAGIEGESGTRARTPHVLAFNSGHPATNEHTHTSAKYEKFVYSTFFGFSVPRAEWGLAQGAFDSMLALSEGDNLYRVKRSSVETRIEEGVVYARWKPWANVDVQTWLVPGTPWHIRVHRIDTARRLDAAEGGFALGIDSGRQPTGTLETRHAEQAVAAVNALGASGIKCVLGGGSVELIQPNANTNLMHPRTVIPTVRTSIQPGVAWLVNGVFGEPAVRGDAMWRAAAWEAAPVAEASAGELRVYAQAGGELLFRRAL